MTKSRRSLTFLAGFLKNPREVGSVVPSSRTLVRRIMRLGDAGAARVIVELGPGTGVITKQVLAAAADDIKVLGIEINPLYLRTLARDINDARLTIYRGPAIEISEALASIDESSADLVVSGIPFSTIPKLEAEKTLERVRDALAPGGRFVAYQFRSEVRRLADPVFGRGETHQGFWNIPPMRIYVWSKR
ncbi:MAG: methyltransferase domain-containing protein [Planctomycetes bacterium]|nr:methyltransferase domain-containing protein [Planctomycetota bacterium]